MEKIRLLISTYDWNYGQALGKAISNLHNDFQVSVEKQEEEDSVIINIDDNEIKIMLTDEHFCEDLTGEIPHGIYKYQLVSEMVKKLRFYRGTTRGRPTLSRCGGGKTKFIGALSATGGAGVTSILIGFGRELCRYRGKKVLYLSFEEFESSRYYFDLQWNEMDLSKYLYYFFYGKQGNFHSCEDSFFNEDSHGLSLFTPSKGHNALTEISQEEVSQLFEKICEIGNFDIVLLDLKSELTEKNFHFIEWCDKILLISEDTITSKAKARALDKYLKGEPLYLDMDKIVYINNKCNIRCESMGGLRREEEIGFNCKLDNNVAIDQGMQAVLDVALGESLSRGEDKRKSFINGAEDKRKHNTNNVEAKMRSNMNMVDDKSERGEEQQVFEIYYDRDSFQYGENTIDISVGNVFGLGVKQIAEEIIGG